MTKRSGLPETIARQVGSSRTSDFARNARPWATLVGGFTLVISVTASCSSPSPTDDDGVMASAGAAPVAGTHGGPGGSGSSGVAGSMAVSGASFGGAPVGGSGVGGAAVSGGSTSAGAPGSSGSPSTGGGAGSSQCAGGMSACGAVCVDLASDATNCGMCGKVCMSGQLCSMGQCAASCNAGQTSCGTACVNTQTNAEHCGACNMACAGGRTCVGGMCQCPMGQSLCGTECVDTQRDAANCGMCGNKCGTGASCSGGMCGGVEGGACNFTLPSYNGNASLTYYTLNMGSAEVNCSFPIMGRNPDRIGYIHTGQGQYFGAMNTTDYNNAAVCGACVEVSRDDGRKVTVTIVDQCPIGTNPKCTRGHIDLSQAAFTQVGTTTEGYLGTGNGGAAGRISWKYVPCPVTGNVTFRLKEPSNQNWNEILVGNHKTPIKQFEAMVGGMWRPGTRQAYNYWSVSMGNLGAGPWRVRVTDVRNNVVEHSLSPGTAEHPSMGQFAGCM